MWACRKRHWCLNHICYARPCSLGCVDLEILVPVVFASLTPASKSDASLQSATWLRSDGRSQSSRSFFIMSCRIDVVPPPCLLTHNGQLTNTKPPCSSRLDVCVVRLRRETLYLAKVDGARSSRTHGLTLQLHGFTLLLGIEAALGVGLDSVDDCCTKRTWSARIELCRNTSFPTGCPKICQVDWPIADGLCGNRGGLPLFNLHSSLDLDLLMGSTRTFTRFSMYRLPTFLLMMTPTADLVTL